MAIQNITDLSEDQENERYSRLKKSLPKLAAASLAIALAVYFSYSSSPWRYVPIVVLASAAVLLIAGAIMKHSVKTEESMHQAKSPEFTGCCASEVRQSSKLKIIQDMHIQPMWELESKGSCAPLHMFVVEQEPKLSNLLMQESFSHMALKESRGVKMDLPLQYT